MSDTVKIYKNVCRITCGDEVGSGFLVAPDLVITADHVVTQAFLEDKCIVTAVFEDDNRPIECAITSGPPANAAPLALLKLNQPRQMERLSLSDSEFEEEQIVHAYGFLPSGQERAENFTLKCTRTYDGKSTNFSFKPTDERLESFSGLSGAPIFHEGHIVGMLCEQELYNSTAYRLNGICGLPFRKILKSLNINLEIYCKDTENGTESVKSTVESLIVKAPYMSELDILLGELFEPIRNDREYGDILKSNTDLKCFLEKLQDRKCSDIKKAEYYYIGAVWMVSDGQIVQAEEYYQNAMKINPELDDAVYRAYTLMNDGAIAEAKMLLKPIDTTMKLNAFLSCLVEEKAPFSAACAVLDTVDCTTDNHTYRLIALSCLQSDEFDTADKYIQMASSNGVFNVQLSVIEALTQYWRAMHSVFPEADRMCFSFAPSYHFYPTKKQKENLDAAYVILEKISEQETVKNDKNFQAIVFWALLVVSHYLPGKDRRYWLAQFQDCARLSAQGFLYCLSNKINIPEELCEEFLALPTPEDDGGIYAHTKVELLLSKGENERAKEYFLENKEEIAAFRSVSPAECEVQFLIASKDYSSARKTLRSAKLATEEKERYELGIQCYEAKRVIKPLVKRITDFAKKTKKKIDYQNAAIICAKYKKWAEAIRNAKEWWENTSEIVALEALAEAQFEKQEYAKCMQTIEKAETLGDTSVYIRQHKLNALVALVRYEEARALANAFDDMETSPRLAILQARTYIAEGKLDNAIRILRNVADKGVCDPELYQMLIELTQPNYPDLAYCYAEQLYHHFPEDSKILRIVGPVALMTGHEHSEICVKYNKLLWEDASRGEYVRMASVEEVQEHIRASQELGKLLDRNYRELKCPIHMVANQDNNELGGIVWRLQSAGTHYSGRYGISKETKVDFRLPLLLDYTSCLTLCRLNLFDKVCTVFDTIWIDQNLFGVWLHDINSLKKVQLSVKRRQNKLYDELLKANYTEQPACELTEENTYDAFDYIMLQCAKSNDAFIVDEQPRGRITGESVPDEWYEFNIQPRDLYAALEALKLKHPCYDASKVNLDAVSKIKPHCNLVLDHNVLIELSESEAIETVFSLFNIILPCETVNLINGEAKINANREEAAKWLEDSCETVVKARDLGKLDMIHAKTTDTKEDSIYIQLLYDEFQIASKSAVTFVVDDRFCSSFNIIPAGRKNSYVITTYDLVSVMYSKGIIGAGEYYSLIDSYFSIGYAYFVPPAEYLFSRLSLAKVDSSETIEEFDVLRKIRKTVAYAFSKEFGLKEEPSGSSMLPEFGGYLYEMGIAFRECLGLIWQSDEPIEWRRSASKWLLTYLGDYLCDTGKGYNDVMKMYALKQTSLLSNCISLQDKGRRKEYVDWLEPYLLASWYVEPDLVDMVANNILGINDSIGLEQVEHTEAMSKLVEILYVNFVLSLPHILRQKLFESPQLARYKELVSRNGSVEKKPTRIILSEELDSFDEKAILEADAEAFENAVMLILSDVDKNADRFIKLFPKEKMYSIEPNNINAIAYFLSELAWFFPSSKMAHLHELKHTLSLRS